MLFAEVRKGSVLGGPGGVRVGDVVRAIGGLRRWPANVPIKAEKLSELLKMRRYRSNAARKDPPLAMKCNCREPLHGMKVSPKDPHPSVIECNRREPPSIKVSPVTIAPHNPLRVTIAFLSSRYTPPIRHARSSSGATPLVKQDVRTAVVAPTPALRAKSLTPSNTNTGVNKRHH